MKNKKVLILTYYWPPAGGAGVQRWLKFVKYLSPMGYDLHVYTAKNAESPANDDSLLKDIPENVTIIKKPIWEPFNIYKKLTQKKGSFNAGFLNEEKKEKKSIMEKLSMFVRANVFVPDAKMFWIRPSTKFLKKYIIEENIELVISSGPPHSLHLIALQLKKETKVKWIADFRDPWTNIDFYKELPMLSWIDKKQHSLEKKVLNTADKILVVGNEMKKEFLEISPSAKVEVITNGYDTSIREDEAVFEKFTITHIGSINPDRSHESFFLAISKFLEENQNAKKQFCLKLVGKVDFDARELISKYELQKYTEFISYLPYDELSGIQEQSHILYLPINNTPNAKGILTGKFFEYLAAKRFVLAQGPINGDIAQILAETNAGEIFDFQDMDGIKNKISILYHNFEKGEYSFKGKNFGKYSRKTLSEDLSNCIQKL